jgi:hypothetical protein
MLSSERAGPQVLSAHLNNPSRARNENIPSSSVRFGIGVSPHSELMRESEIRIDSNGINGAGGRFSFWIGREYRRSG